MAEESSKRPAIHSVSDRSKTASRPSKVPSGSCPMVSSRSTRPAALAAAPMSARQCAKLAAARLHVRRSPNASATAIASWLRSAEFRDPALEPSVGAEGHDRHRLRAARRRVTHDRIGLLRGGRGELESGGLRGVPERVDEELDAAIAIADRFQHLERVKSHLDGPIRVPGRRRQACRLGEKGGMVETGQRIGRRDSGPQLERALGVVERLLVGMDGGECVERTNGALERPRQVVGVIGVDGEVGHDREVVASACPQERVEVIDEPSVAAPLGRDGARRRRPLATGRVETNRPVRRPSRRERGCAPRSPRARRPRASRGAGRPGGPRRGETGRR